MYDHLDDRNHKVLYGVSKVIDLPEFVKEASAEEEDVSSLPSSCFADPGMRKYPVHTKKDAYLSRLYFTKHASMYKQAGRREIVKKNIERAAKFWELEDSYQTISKEASLDNRVPIQGYDGSVIDSLPLNSPRDFEKAAIMIFENKDNFTYPQRRTIARSLLGSGLAKEAQISTEVSEYLEKAAGYGMSTRGHVLDGLAKRASIYGHKDPAFAEKLALAAMSIDKGDITPDTLDKIAAIVDVCDHELGLRRYYRKGLESPEEMAFPFTEKLCKEIQSSLVKLQNGQAVEVEKLSEEVLDSFFDKHMGEIPQAPYEEKLQIVRTLPATDADALVSFVS
jgi:hypothetical protein